MRSALLLHEGSGAFRAEGRDVGDVAAPERHRLQVEREGPGVHGQAVDLDEPDHGVLRDHVRAQELRLEIAHLQHVPDLFGLAAHRGLGDPERGAQLVGGTVQLTGRVEQEIDLPQSVDDGGGPGDATAARQRRGALAGSFATTSRARLAYSASRSFAQTSSVMPMISSATGRAAFGMFSSSGSATAGFWHGTRAQGGGYRARNHGRSGSMRAENGCGGQAQYGGELAARPLRHR